MIPGFFKKRAPAGALKFLVAAGCALAPALPAQAEFLFNQYLIPSFDGEPNTEFSRWNVFYAANVAPNYPDAFAPHGIKQTASAAGFSEPFSNAWSPSNPEAFWHVDNPTITQNIPNAAFITGPGSTGNIYSFTTATQFTLADTTPYTLGTVVFQFQTLGTQVDFNSIKLVYDDGGVDVFLDPDEYIREYRFGTSGLGGQDNRNALQWDLADLGINSYRIVWEASSSSMSFQEALLDTAQDYAPVVPESRTWNAAGAGNWSNGANWEQGTTSIANANVRFDNPDAATINLDGNRTVAEIIFETGNEVTINSAGSTVTANTGITTTADADGVYVINSNYQFGAFNVFDIQAGEVEFNGVVSGPYGFLKQGGGALTFSNNNTFTGPVTQFGGTLRMEGANSYSGITNAIFGELIVSGSVLPSVNGPLGNATSAILLGADSATFEFVDAGTASLLIDGDHTIGRGVNLAAGDYEKHLGAFNTTTGATFSGAINFGPSATFAADKVKLVAMGNDDVVHFTGAMTGGATSRSVTIEGPGTIVYSGANKTYANATIVKNGHLLIASGTAVTGNGNFTVEDGGKLQVDGSISGTGAFSLLDGTVGGEGLISRTVVTAGTASVISPGNSTGTLTFASLNASAGATFHFDLGLDSDMLVIQGLFTGGAAPESLRFHFADAGGLQTGVVYTLIEFDTASGLDVADFFLASPGFVLDPGFGTDGWNLDTDNGFLQVRFTAIPEPTAAWLLPAAAAALLLRRAKQRRTT